MSQERIDALLAMTQDQPDNVMVWYGLANELVKLEKWAEAVDALHQVIRLNPDYTAAYQMLGTALSQQGNITEAQRIWQSGIEVATRTGAWKARQHMEGLLSAAGNQPGSEFCQE